MSIPFPYNAVMGRVKIDEQARSLAVAVEQIAAMSERLLGDATGHDLKRLAQLAEQCRLLVDIIALFLPIDPKGAFVGAVRTALDGRGMVFDSIDAMLAGLTALRTNALAFLSFGQNRFPPPRVIAEVVCDQDWRMTESARVVPIDPAIVAALQALRDSYGPSA
jgi:hypothetical protein